MTTNNSVNVGLSGATGTGNFVGSSSPSLITPNIGVATAASVAFSPTTNGIVGTSTNNNASSGYVGEVITAIAGGVSLSNNINIDTTSISLTAGDWDVQGFVIFATVTANLTSTSGWINTTSATKPGNNIYALFQWVSAVGSTNMSVPYQRISIATTTTVYLSVVATFSSGSVTGSGTISARRAR